MPIFILALGEDQLSEVDLGAVRQALPPDFRFVQTTDEKKILSLASPSLVKRVGKILI